MTETQMFRDLNKNNYFTVFIDENRYIYKAHFKKIESGRTEIGVPDVYFYLEGHVKSVTGWIELKIAKYIKKTGEIVVPYRPGQIKFLSEHYSCNTNTYTLIYYNNIYHLTSNFVRVFKNVDELFKYSQDFLFISYTNFKQSLLGL